MSDFIPITHSIGNHPCMQTAFEAVSTLVPGETITHQKIKHSDGSPCRAAERLVCGHCGIAVWPVMHDGSIVAKDF